MELRELSIQTVQKHKYQKSFNSSVWCIQEMYWYQLRELKTKDLAKIVVVLGDDKPRRKFGNILSVYYSFDFEEYFKIQEYERKKVILEILHSELLALCDEQEIDKEKLNGAFNYCIEHDLDNRWFFKNKYFRSPNCKYYGAMECHWTADKFTVNGIIFDKKKNELFRQLLVEKEPFLGDFIYYCKCGWDSDAFFIQSQKNERWEISSK